jgi:hypothetical protein
VSSCGLVPVPQAAGACARTFEQRIEAATHDAEQQRDESHPNLLNPSNRSSDDELVAWSGFRFLAAVTGAVDGEPDDGGREEQPYLDRQDCDNSRRIQWPHRADGGNRYADEDHGHSDPRRLEEPHREPAEHDRRY